MGFLTKSGFFGAGSIEVTDFDKVDDYVSIPSAGLWDLQSLKINVNWIYNSTDSQYILASRGTGVSFLILYVAGRLRFYVGNSAGSYFGGTYVWLWLPDYATIGDIVEIEATFNGTQLSVTANGSPAATLSGVGDMYSPTDPIIVGASELFGELSDAPIYNLRIGTLTTVRGQWHNTTWEDQINSADGTINGSPTLATVNDTAATVGELLTEFDGVDDSVTIPSTGLWDSTSFRVAFMFMVSDKATDQTLVSSRPNGGNPNFAFHINITGTNFSFDVGVSGFYGGAVRNVTTPTTSYTNGDFVECVATYDGSTISLTIDGVTVTKSLASTITTAGGEPVRVSGFGTTPNDLMEGVVCNLEIGSIATVRSSFNNSTWVDEVGSADGTIFGSPTLATIWPQQ